MSDHDLKTIERPLSLEEFQRMPEEDAFHVELVRGRLVREPLPGARHGRLNALLLGRIDAHVRAHDLGVTLAEAGFILSVEPPTVRGPDIAFLAKRCLPPEGVPVGFWPGAPDLAVEIVSPSNRVGEIQEKVLEYLAAGARLVWIVDPSTQSVAVYRSREKIHILTAEDALEGFDVLPGFRLSVSELFGSV